MIGKQHLKSLLQSQPQPRRIGTGLGIVLYLLFLIPTYFLIPLITFAQAHPLKKTKSLFKMPTISTIPRNIQRRLKHIRLY